MDIGLEFVLGAVVCFGALVYVWYVILIVRRNRVREALGAIDAQLQQRHDLLPNILRLADRFMAHERDLMARLTELRAAAEQPYRREDPDEVRAHLATADELGGLLGRFFAVAEAYPELRSQETVVTAQHTYTEVEGHISAARRFYNSGVAELNNAIEIFPGRLIAGLAGVRAMPFFEAGDTAARTAVRVDEHMT